MSTHKKEGEGFLSNISDLMSGLMIVFLIIAIAYMHHIEQAKSELEALAENNRLIAEKNRRMAEEYQRMADTYKKTQESIKSIADTYRQTQLNMYNDLMTEFRDDLKKWHAEIDKDSLAIRFNDERVMFDTGKVDLKEDFKKILRDFFPRYVNIAFDHKYAHSIYGVSIEGHTSSEWAGAASKDDAYFRNMALSQARTRAVLSFCYGLDGMQPYRKKMIRYVTANGLSYSHAVYDASGRENKDRSRRVEFRIVINADKEIRNILNEFQEDELMFGRGFNAAMNEYGL